MNDKRGRQRLKELFSNLDLLSANPARNAVGLQQESQRPASQVVEVEYAGPDVRTETLPASTSPLPDHSIAISSPRESKVDAIGDMQVTPLPGRQLTVEEQGQADLKDFGIGVVSGTLVTGIILASTAQMDIFNNLGRFALLGGEVLFGVLGAFAAKSSSKRSRDIWIGAIEWSLVPVWIGLFIIFLLYALSFTNLFGV